MLDMFCILFIVIVDSWNVNKISISISTHTLPVLFTNKKVKLLCTPLRHKRGAEV